MFDEAGRFTIAWWQFFLGLTRRPLNLIDTSAGPSSEALPPAEANRNQELIYKKISADIHVFTLTGGAEGPQTLTTQYAMLRLQSDGSYWWVVGVLP